MTSRVTLRAASFRYCTVGKKSRRSGMCRGYCFGFSKLMLCASPCFFFLMTRRPPSSPLFPSPTLSRSGSGAAVPAVPLDDGPPLDEVRFVAGEGLFAGDGPALGNPPRSNRPWLVTGGALGLPSAGPDRKSTRLNSSHLVIS